MPDAPLTDPAPAARSLAHALEPLIGRRHAAIVGLQWGDEGKGQLVDLLTAHFDVIARFNGGNNAGHSVQIGKEKFALHLLPSGITHEDKLNVIGNGLVVDPTPETGILKEIDAIRRRGVGVEENLRISSRAHVVMPYHRIEDALSERLASQQRGDTSAIGTTGRGIGPCYADKANRVTAVRMGELLDLDRLLGRVDEIVRIKNGLLGALASLSRAPFEPLDAEALKGQIADWSERLQPFICDTRSLLVEAQHRRRRILFEGANAALLDVDHGTYPFVTSSSTSALGIGPGVGLPPTDLDSVVGVAKAYTSRVGGGPHPTELNDPTGEQIRQAGNEFGTTTGRPRRCGWLDATAVRYAAQLNGATALVLTGLSVLAELNPLKICVGYRTHDGRELRTFPADTYELQHAEPIYETLPGFDGPLGELRDERALPENARAYVDRVEALVGVPIRVVCVGPRRDQAIAREPKR